MRRSWLRLCAGSTMLGATLVVGCQHHQSCNCGQNAVVKSSTTAPPPAMASDYRPVTEPPVTLPLINDTVKDLPKAEETPAEPPVEQANFVKTIPEEKEKIRRRSFADISADPCFAHAEDYTSVTGELYYTKATKTWTVRYASVDEEDRYGGSVTLTDLGDMEKYESGMMVHVEGRMVDPESKTTCPEFRVISIETVKK